MAWSGSRGVLVNYLTATGVNSPAFASTVYTTVSRRSLGFVPSLVDAPRTLQTLQCSGV